MLDEKHDLYLRLNKELVTMDEVTEKYDIAELKAILQKHVDATGSALGARILEHFTEYLPSFKKIVPNDYYRMLSAISSFEEKGLSHKEATLEAFYEIQKG